MATDKEKEEILSKTLVELIGPDKVDELEKAIDALCQLPAASAADQKWKDKYFLVRGALIGLIEPLIGLVGHETMVELEELEKALKLIPAPSEVVVAAIDAFRTLIETDEYYD